MDGSVSHLNQESPTVEALLTEGRHYRDVGNCVAAIASFSRAARIAASNGKIVTQGLAELAISGCEIRLFRYKAALSTLTSAEKIAGHTDNHDLLGAIAGNVSVVYSQLGDYSAAETASRKAVRYLESSGHHDYLSLAFINLGEIEFGLQRSSEGKQSFSKAIEVARKFGLKAREAEASDDLGIWLVLGGELEKAEPLLRKSLQIREGIGDRSTIAASLLHIAELEEKKGDKYLPAALANIDRALANRKSLSSAPYYYPVHLRGRIYLKLGRKQAALAEFRQAANAADVWRESALPGDATNTKAVSQLGDVYGDYVHLAASVAFSTKNATLAHTAFDVLTRHRASSLHEQLTHAYRSKLLDSPEYCSLLQDLQVAQAKVTLTFDQVGSAQDRKPLNLIRAKLNDLENRLGVSEEDQNYHVNKNRGKSPLRDIQSRLEPDAALLSITLGDPSSYLWAVTKTAWRLYQLPSRQIIEDRANEFRKFVRNSSLNRSMKLAGRNLYTALFSQLPPSIAAKTEWLIAADGELLDAMPFAALPGFSGNDQREIIQRHSLRTLPGALLPSTSAKSPEAGKFTGVGDPVYNRADSRWGSRDRPFEKATSSGFRVLARLIGGQKELRASADSCGLLHSRLLMGRDASSALIREDIVALPPSILHFAVHVVSPDRRPGEAAIALSLTKYGVPELLTPEIVSALKLPGTLVVISGCSSQQGEVLSGSGIVGLSRSWLLAGADAVVVSSWPTPDNSGNFFPSFYRRYHQLQGTVAHRAALALQRTQLEMLSNGGYQSEAWFWAAYSIVSKN